MQSKRINIGNKSYRLAVRSLKPVIIIIRNKRGVTLIELIIGVSIIVIIAILTAPQISRFRSTYNLRSCATDLIQNMRLARAMAIKENRQYLIVFNTANNRYLIGFDGDGDNGLTTANSDTFGICKDTDGNRLPNNDTDTNGDGVPDCVRVVNLSDCGDNLRFGYGTGTTPPNGPNGATIPVSGVGFNGAWVDFNPNGSTDNRASNADSVYFQHTGRGYSYCVQISNTSGGMNMWKWDGDKDNTSITTWTEIR